MATAFVSEEDVMATAFDLLKQANILVGDANENINFVCGVLDMASAMIHKIKDSYPNREEKGE